jgi:hypothetical protein
MNKIQYMNPIDMLNEAITRQQKRIERFDTPNKSPGTSQILSEARKALAASIRIRDSMLRKVRALKGNAQ